MKYLIIPSATYVPADVNQLYRVPMALLPINGEPIANLIMSHYSNDFKTIISAYDGYELFKQNSFGSRKIKIIKIDSLKDVGFTILNTLEKLPITDEDSVVINFADTVTDNNDLTSNSIVCQSTKQVNRKWTYFDTEEGVIKKVIDKSSDLNVDNKDLLLVCGVFSINKPLSFISCLRNNITDNGCNFYNSLKQYSIKNPFSFIEAQNWMDIGHPDEYFNSKIAIKSRQFNHMVFDKNRGIIKKKSDDENKLISEISWFLKLPKNLQYVTPRIYDYSLVPGNVFVEMEYYSYPTLLELFLFGGLDKSSWEKIFARIGAVLNDFKQYKKSEPEINDSLRDMYLEKTVVRIDKMRNHEAFKPFFEENIIINGKTFRSLNEILKIVPNIVSDNLLQIDEFNIIHGDMCFANILIDEKLNFIKLIDPRGSFGKYDIFGDLRYELAKIFHSVDGKYDFIIKDFFTLNVSHNKINYNIKKSSIDLYQIAKETFKELIGSHLKEIEIIESLLFLSMIPLHSENVDHQILMMSVGLEILNRWINIEENSNGNE